MFCVSDAGLGSDADFTANSKPRAEFILKTCALNSLYKRTPDETVVFRRAFQSLINGLIARQADEARAALSPSFQMMLKEGLAGARLSFIFKEDLICEKQKFRVRLSPTWRT